MSRNAPRRENHRSGRWSDTALTQLLGIDVPIVLGAFGGASSVALTAAVSDGGGLGSYGLYGYSGERVLETANALRAASDRPFALNLWLPHTEAGEDAADPDGALFQAAATRLAPFFEAVGIDAPSAAPGRYLPDFDEQLDAVIEAAPAVLSLVFGVPDASLVARCHARGIHVMATATTVDEGIALAAAGVDVVVASGMEAGGHRVSFLRPAEDSLVGTIALVPQLIDAVDVPVIAAGGIGDARGLAASLMLGASGAVLGTAFLATRESAIAPAYRRALLTAESHGERSRATALTRALSGRLARGIPNTAMESIVAPAAFPMQNWLTAQFRARASEQDNAELLSLWAGQAVALAHDVSASELLRELVDGTEALLGR